MERLAGSRGRTHRLHSCVAILTQHREGRCGRQHLRQTRPAQHLCADVQHNSTGAVTPTSERCVAIPLTKTSQVAVAASKCSNALNWHHGQRTARKFSAAHTPYSSHEIQHTPNPAKHTRTASQPATHPRPVPRPAPLSGAPCAAPWEPAAQAASCPAAPSTPSCSRHGRTGQIALRHAPPPGKPEWGRGGTGAACRCAAGCRRGRGRGVRAGAGQALLAPACGN